MKKTLTLLAIMAAIGPAWGADVISSNVVGYNKITLHPGMNMIGGLFQGVGTGRALPLNGQFANDVAVATGGADTTDSDTIMTFDAENQGYDVTYFYYYFEGEDEAYNNKWYNGLDDSEPTTDSIDPGAGVWYRNRSDSAIQIQMAGEVPTNGTYQVTLYPGMNFIANPYPAAIPLNGTSFTVTGVTGGADTTDSDTIMTFDAENQGYDVTYFFYFFEGEDEEYNNKWYNGLDDSEPTPDTLAPGAGFWYRHRGSSNATLTFAKPY